MMELNIPILDQLSQCKNLLIAGMGGGFDIFCGLPIYFELQRRGITPHLANFSFACISDLDEGIRLTETLVGVTGDVSELYPYFPEGHLARWFKERRREDVTVWCFHKTGPAPLIEDYRILAQHLSLDGILLVDGGVDSLMQGDEAEQGTLIEDATSLVAVNALTGIPHRFMVCTALGAELDITYAHVFENIAALTKAGGFLGACALAPQMESYQLYEEAVLFVQDVPYQEPSVVNSSIISAVRGNYGDYHLTQKTNGSRLWISPLMGLYWFFDFAVVIQHNGFLSEIAQTETFLDAVKRFMSFRRRLQPRPSMPIPL